MTFQKTLKKFQSRMRKKFGKAKNKEVKMLISSLIVLALSVAYAADRFFFSAVPGIKVGFKPDDGPIMVIMAALILVSSLVVLYFGTRYR